MRPSHRAASETLPDAARSPRTTCTSAFPSSAPAWRRRLPPAAEASPDRIRPANRGWKPAPGGEPFPDVERRTGTRRRHPSNSRAVDLVVAELLEHAGHVVAHVDQAELAIAQRRAAVALQIDADHLPALRELGQVGTEHLDLAQPAMKEQQRLACAVHGVVVVDAIDASMAGLDGLG